MSAPLHLPLGVPEVETFQAWVYDQRNPQPSLNQISDLLYLEDGKVMLRGPDVQALQQAEAMLRRLEIPLTPGLLSTATLIPQERCTAYLKAIYHHASMAHPMARTTYERELQEWQRAKKVAILDHYLPGVCSTEQDYTNLQRDIDTLLEELHHGAFDTEYWDAWASAVEALRLTVLYWHARGAEAQRAALKETL